MGFFKDKRIEAEKAEKKSRRKSKVQKGREVEQVEQVIPDRVMRRPTPPPTPESPVGSSCFGGCRRNKRQRERRLRRVETPQEEEEEEEDVVMPPGPLFIRRHLRPDSGPSGSGGHVVSLPPLVATSPSPPPTPSPEPRRLRRNDIQPACSEILAQLEAEEQLGNAHQLHRADLIVRSRAQHNFGGMRWDLEDPTTVRPVSRHAPSNAPRRFQPVERLACGSQSSTGHHGDYVLSLAEKEARSRRVLAAQEEQRQEQFRQRRDRVAESRARCRETRERQRAEAAERAEASHTYFHGYGDQPNASLPPLPTIPDLDRHQPHASNSQFWSLVGNGMLDLM